jgi:hypothetical protein
MSFPNNHSQFPTESRQVEQPLGCALGSRARTGSTKSLASGGDRERSTAMRDDDHGGGMRPSRSGAELASRWNRFGKSLRETPHWAGDARKSGLIWLSDTRRLESLIETAMKLRQSPAWVGFESRRRASIHARYRCSNAPHSNRVLTNVVTNSPSRFRFATGSNTETRRIRVTSSIHPCNLKMEAGSLSWSHTPIAKDVDQKYRKSIGPPATSIGETQLRLPSEIAASIAGRETRQKASLAFA